MVRRAASFLFGRRVWLWPHAILRGGTFLRGSLLLWGIASAGHEPDVLGAAHILASAGVDLYPVAFFHKQGHLDF